MLILESAMQLTMLSTSHALLVRIIMFLPEIVMNIGMTILQPFVLTLMS